MSETKHWDVYVRECPAGDCGRGVWIQEFGHNGTPVRTVVDTGALDAWPLNDADRRLIAAAPELLEALKDTLHLAEAYYNTLPDDGEAQDHYMTSVIEPARKAIAKAEGGEA